MNSQLNVAVRKNEQDDDVTILRTEDSYLRKCFNDRKAFDSEALYSFKTVLWWPCFYFIVLAHKEEMDRVVQSWYGVLGVRLQERDCFEIRDLTIAVTGLIVLKVQGHSETHCSDVNYVYVSG